MVKASIPVVFPRTLETTHVVSWWHIPNSSDYHNAVGCVAFFNDEETAKSFAKEKGEYPPEMAMVFTIEKFDAAKKL